MQNQELHISVMTGSCWGVPGFCWARILKCHLLWHSWGELPVLRVLECLQTSGDEPCTVHTLGIGFHSGVKATKAAGNCSPMWAWKRSFHSAQARLAYLGNAFPSSSGVCIWVVPTAAKLSKESCVQHVLNWHEIRITEWFESKGTLKITSFQPSCHQQGHSPLDQAVRTLSSLAWTLPRTG